MKTQKRGFSLIELMMAIFIISCVLLLMIGLFTLLFNTSKKGVDMTAGIATAEMLMEEYLYQQDSVMKAPTFAFTSELNASGTKSLNGVTFTYYIHVSKAKDNNSVKFRQVEETIYWWQNSAHTQGAAFAKSQGMTFTKITKCIWLEGL
jgi:prepilin-type N-terminal cleavage/methylation domain-containing protein